MGWDSETAFHGQFAIENVRKGRTYSHIAFDPSTNLILAASNSRCEYILFDDEGNSVWEPDGEPLLSFSPTFTKFMLSAANVSFPTLPVSSLELVDPAHWTTIDG